MIITQVLQFTFETNSSPKTTKSSNMEIVWLWSPGMTISQQQQPPKKHNLNSTFRKVFGNSFGCSFQWGDCGSCCCCCCCLSTTTINVARDLESGILLYGVQLCEEPYYYMYDIYAEKEISAMTIQKITRRQSSAVTILWESTHKVADHRFLHHK